MLIVMKPNAAPQDVDAVVTLIQEIGLRPCALVLGILDLALHLLEVDAGLVVLFVQVGDFDPQLVDLGLDLLLRGGGHGSRRQSRDQQTQHGREAEKNPEGPAGKHLPES